MHALCLEIEITGASPAWQRGYHCFQDAAQLFITACNSMRHFVK